MRYHFVKKSYHLTNKCRKIPVNREKEDGRSSEIAIKGLHSNDRLSRKKLLSVYDPVCFFDLRSTYCVGVTPNTFLNARVKLGVSL